MPNLHVLMTNHTDINSIKLLIKQLPFIKDHYETFIVECVPYGVKNEDVLKYLSKVMLTYVLDLTQVNDKLGLSQTHLLALKNIFTTSLTDEEKMQLKYEAVKEIVDGNKLAFEPNIKQLFYQFYYYHYFSEALKNGIELVGVESSSYSPGTGITQVTRDQDILVNTSMVMKDKKNCLMLLGASHGVDLIKTNKQNGVMKNSYTHLCCDNSSINVNSHSQVFKKEIESGDYSLSDNQSYLYLDLSKNNMNEQATVFQARVLATKSKKPVYHEYGRKHLEAKSFFCQDLAKLSGLPFSMTLDKEYNADTLCTIDDKDKKQSAKTIQKKTGVGTFFKNDKGANVFVVKNTNAPENSDFLKQAIIKGSFNPGA